MGDFDRYFCKKDIFEVNIRGNFQQKQEIPPHPLQQLLVLPNDSAGLFDGLFELKR
jgi:hypothetical protein